MLFSQAKKFPYLFIIFLFLGFTIFINLQDSRAVAQNDLNPPRTPLGFSIKTKNNSLEVSWKENTEWDIFSYLIYIRTGDEKEDLNPILTGKTDHFEIKNLDPNKTYYVSLAARDIAGNISKPTYEIGISPAASEISKDYSVAVWAPLVDLNDVSNSIENNIEIFDIISPLEYRMEPDGKITRVGQVFSPEIKEKVKSQSIKIIPTITNNFDENKKASELLKSDNLINEHLKNIINEVEKENYDGIDIDYENLEFEVKDQFSNFIQKLADQLHQKNKFLSITVQPKTSDYDLGNGVGAVDFEKIGQVVDYFRIMTYDFSRPDTKPGPIAPIDWFRQVIEYTKTKVPQEKIIVGIPFYGYKWCLDGKGDQCKNQGLVWQGVKNIIAKYQPKVEWNDQAKSPWFLYTDENNNSFIVNFEDHQSLQYKLEAVKEMKVGGIAIWRLGGEDPDNFKIIQEKLDKKVGPINHIKVTPDNNMIHLSWEPGHYKNLQGYRIFVQKKDDQNLNEKGEVFSQKKTINVLDQTEYTIPDLENNTPYYISLAPVIWDYSGDKEKLKSKPILVTPQDLIYPGKISDLKVEEIGSTTIDLSWTTPGDDDFTGQITSYEIRYSDKKITPENFKKAEKYLFSPEPKEPKTTVHWQLRNLKSGVNYYIAIKAFDEEKNSSELSNVVSAQTIDNIPPKTPSPPKVISKNKSLLISWQPNKEEDLAGYKIYYRQEKSYYQTQMVDKDKTTFTLNNLENNYHYYIALSAVDHMGNESIRSADVEGIPQAEDLIGRLESQSLRLQEKARAQAMIFGKRLMDKDSIPYLVMFSVIIINIFIYRNIREEVRKKFSKRAISKIPTPQQRPKVIDLKGKKTVLRSLN